MKVSYSKRIDHSHKKKQSKNLRVVIAFAIAALFR